MASREEANEIHRTLLNDIASELVEDDLAELKNIALGDRRVRRGKLLSLKRAVEVLDFLDKSGYVSLKNYGNLKSAFRKMENARAVEIIEDAEKALGCEQGEYTNNSEPTSGKRPRLSNAGPSTARIDDIDSDLSNNPCYKTAKSQGCGVLAIINQFTEQREGTAADEEKINSLFRGRLNFHCLKPKRDLSRANFLAELEKFTKQINDMSKIPTCLVFVVMSHGNEHGIQTCASPKEEEPNGYVKVNEILSYFKADKLQRLQDRPKLFLIQACRGTVAQGGVIRTDDNAELMVQNDVSEMIPSTPVDADMVVAYSTTKGYKSFRHIHQGSFFIARVVEIFEKYHKSEHVVDMLTRVNSAIADEELREHPEEPIRKQMSCFSSTLRKRFHLPS